MKYWCGLFLLLSSFARGESTWNLGVRTKLEAIHFGESLDDNITQNQFRFELNPDLVFNISETWELKTSPVYIGDPENKSEKEKNFFDWNESYLKLQGETWSLKVGSTIVNWGVTDGFNPLDPVNSRQYFDPLRARKLGEASLVLSQAFDFFDYELVYIPQKRGSLLPGSQSRWLPREIYVPYTPENNIVLVLPSELRYTFKEEEDLDQAREQNAALRLQFHAAGFDLGVMGYEGSSSFPLIQPEVTGAITEITPKTVVEVDPDVLLRQRFYRLRQAGLWLVRQQGRYLLKYATSYSQSLGNNPNLPGWLHESVLAIEKTFSVGSEGSLIALLQYSFINSEFRNDSNLSVTEIFRDAWMGGGRFSWQELWTVSFLGLYHRDSQSSYFELGLSRRFFDVWTATLMGNSIQGPDDSVLGVYRKNDSVSLSLSRSF